MIPSFTSAAVLTQKGGLNLESTGFENHFPRTDFIILRPNTYAPLIPTGVTSIFTIVSQWVLKAGRGPMIRMSHITLRMGLLATYAPYDSPATPESLGMTYPP